MKTKKSMRSASMMSLTVLFTSALGGCGSDATGPTGPTTELVVVAAIAPGATCPSGGIAVTSGTDQNGDGTLDADEITNTQDVCNGPQQPDPAVVLGTTILAEGSDACPLGGSLVSSGLDNGDGGGTAGNGALEAGEVDSTIAVCSGEPVGDYDLSPPAGAPGVSVVSLNGGNATGTGEGGKAGTFRIGDSTPGLSTPMSIAVFSTGSVDTAHVVPTVTPDFGADPLSPASDLTLSPAPLAPACVDGVVYILESAPMRLVRCHVAATNYYTVITGLNVPAGVTLTVSRNVALFFSEDVFIAGTVTSLPNASNARQSVSLIARNMLVAETGVLALEAPPGGASGAAARVSLRANGTLVNLGTLRSRGAAHGAVVSAADNVFLRADILYNAGAIDASGGSLATTNGAAAGNVTFTASRALVNVGPITAVGGSGDAGGAGGAVTMTLEGADRAGPTGVLVNTGAITTTGGSCDSNAAIAGAGGNVAFSATSGRIRHTSAVNASGGGSNGVATLCTGGAGGSLSFTALSLDAGWDAGSLIDVGGNITLAGGFAGGGGGAGGSLTVAVRRPRGGLSRMFGYATLSLAGGNGLGTAGYGGAGGTVAHETAPVASMGLFPVHIPEQIHIHPLITATGGIGAGGVAGGHGGEISLLHISPGHNQTSGASDEPALLLVGGANLVAGDGASSGGSSGSFVCVAYGDVVIAGPLTLNGATGLLGSPGGDISIDTTGDVVLSGAIGIHGSAGLPSGGEGGNLSVFGAHVTLSGAVSAVGGGGTTSPGGHGGVVEVQSFDAPSTVTGTIDVAAGVSTDPGGLNSAAQPGSITVDGVGI